jgi:putative DeoR family transcriptional regulator (stage III sporulation protein D)
LAAINKNLYAQVRDVLEENKAQRHIRGGLAARNKYIREKAADEAQQTP